MGKVTSRLSAAIKNRSSIGVSLSIHLCPLFDHGCGGWSYIPGTHLSRWRWPWRTHRFVHRLGFRVAFLLIVLLMIPERVSRRTTSSSSPPILSDFSASESDINTSFATPGRVKSDCIFFFYFFVWKVHFTLLR